MMMRDYQWLMDLKSQIVDTKDVRNFEDIINCYQSGLLRAGFLLAWLMLIESLKRKIITLADKEVKIAVKELEGINRIEDSMHSNDEAIWKSAAKCDLITKEEESVIELLWKKRCIMSHPYMPEVKESDFRYMAENLVAISLSKSLVWSKTMIDDFISDIKSNLFLIPDEQAEKNDFADRIVSQIPERLYPYFWKTVFYEYSLAHESGVKKTLLMLAVLAIKIVKTVGENINCPQYGMESRIRDYCAVCWEIFFNKKAWGYLNKDYQDQMFRFLKDKKKEARTVLRQAMRLIDYRDDIDDKNIACYYEALGQYSITSVYQYYIDKDRLVKRIYDDKVKNFQFDDQGDFIDMLNNMDEEDINDFSSKQQQELGKYVMICCNTGTFKAENFVKSNNKWVKHLGFAKGFAIEGMTDEKGCLRIFKKQLEFVLYVLYYTKVSYRTKVIESLYELPLDRSIREEMIESILKNLVSKFFSEEDSKDVYDQLIGLIEKFYR